MIRTCSASTRCIPALRLIPMAVVLCAMCLLLSACAGKKTHEADSVRSIVVNLAAKQAADPDVPGLSVAVLRRGQDAPISAAFGKTSLENPTPVTTASLFKIGSVTKVFTSTLIHRLIEEGKLSYDTPISQFFPTYPNGKAITVRNLLEHTSGIPEMLALPAVQQNLARYWSPEDLIGMVAKQPPIFKPGTPSVIAILAFSCLPLLQKRLRAVPMQNRCAKLLQISWA